MRIAICEALAPTATSISAPLKVGIVTNEPFVVIRLTKAAREAAGVAIALSAGYRTKMAPVALGIGIGGLLRRPAGEAAKQEGESPVTVS